MAKEGAKKETKATWNERDVLDANAARQFGYSLLTRAFLESPNQDFINAVCDEKLLDAIPYQSVNNAVSDGLDRVRADIYPEGGLSEERVFQFGDDYMQLFVGPGKLPAPPWEAVYRSDKRRIFQKETVEVRRAYESYKLQPKKFKQEPDDHMAFELEFMSRLCGFFDDSIKAKKYANARKIVNSQMEFLDLHMLKWVSAFCDDIRNHAHTDFYRGMAGVLEGYLTQDREYLGTLFDAVSEKEKTEKKKASAAKKAATSPNGSSAAAAKKRPAPKAKSTATKTRSTVKAAE